MLMACGVSLGVAQLEKQIRKCQQPIDLYVPFLLGLIIISFE